MDKPNPTAKRKAPAAKAKSAPYKKFRSIGIPLALILAFSAIVGFIYTENADMMAPAPITIASPPVKSEYKFDQKGYNFDARYPEFPLPPDAPVLHVLFIGDSYTLVNNMPFMLAAVAASDTASPVNIKPETYGLAGSTLGDLWPGQDGHARLHARSWDYVVLQDMGLLPTNTMKAPQMYDAMTKWNTEIRQTGARVVIYQTWAMKPYSDWYLAPERHRNFDLVSPEIMQNKIDAVTGDIATKIGASVVPVGDIWEACRDRPGMPDLYLADGSNPSLAGDYLVALLFYQMLTRHKPDNVSYVPPGISAEQAQLLKKCASYGG